MKKYKSEKYDGYEVNFNEIRGAHPNYKIGAKVPKLMKQYAGLARTKTLAFEEAKEFIDMHRVVKLKVR